METETDFLEFIGAVVRRYGEDIGQETALRLLEYQAKGRGKWSKRIGWLIAKKLSGVMDQHWRELVITSDSSSEGYTIGSLESFVVCKEIMALPESQRILAHLAGQDHFSRERLHQLRVKLAAKLKRIKPTVNVTCRKRERKFRQRQRAKVEGLARRNYCSL